MVFGDQSVPLSKSKQSQGIVPTIKSFYYDPFKWQLVKSWALFGVGIFVAREIAAIDLNAPQIVSV